MAWLHSSLCDRRTRRWADHRTRACPNITERYSGNIGGTGIRGRDADLWGANLQKANLQRANLQNVNLQGASVQGANFQGADLRRANLHHSVGLSWTQLKSAASYEGAILPDYLLEPRPGEPNTP